MTYRPTIVAKINDNQAQRTHGTPMQATENQQKRIYVAGHRGMVGAAIVRTLTGRGQMDIITRTHAELDLTDQAQVRHFFESEKK